MILGAPGHIGIECNMSDVKVGSIPYATWYLMSVISPLLKRSGTRVCGRHRSLSFAHVMKNRELGKTTIGWYTVTILFRDTL